MPLRRLLALWIAAVLAAGGLALADHDSSSVAVEAGRGRTEVTLPPLSEATLPDITVPGISLPEVGLPEVTIPDLPLPDVPLPDLPVPDLPLPDTTVPPSLPDVALPPEVPGPVDELLGQADDPLAVDRRGLWLVDADRHRAQVFLADLHPTAVSLSPDGRRAVVTTYPTANYHGSEPITTWIVDLRTGGRRELLPPMAGIGAPSWSPDGAWIAYNSLPGRIQPTERSPSAPPGPSSVREIWLIRPDGRDHHRLTITDGFGGRISWSPDGGRLSTSLWNDGRLLVADVRAGTEQRFPAHEVHLTDWSPDGARLAFSSGHHGPLSIMDPATGATTVIDQEAAFPRWSPTGEWIAVRRGGQAQVLRPDGSPGPTLGGGMPVNWSGDGTSLLLNEGGGTVLVADVASGTSRVVAASTAADRLRLSPSVWVPGTRTFAMLVAGHSWYLP